VVAQAHEGSAVAFFQQTRAVLCKWPADSLLQESPFYEDASLAFLHALDHHLETMGRDGTVRPGAEKSRHDVEVPPVGLGVSFVDSGRAASALEDRPEVGPEPAKPALLPGNVHFADQSESSLRIGVAHVPRELDAL